MAVDGTSLEQIVMLLDGGTEIDQLSYLSRALRPGQGRLSPDLSVAIGLDANVLLNLGKGRKGADVVDFLSQRHEGPVILPSQALLEFWNNQAGGIHGLGERLRERFDALSEVISELDPEYSEFAAGATRLVSEFQDRYGHVIEERTAGQILALLDALQGKAYVPQLPRLQLDPVATRRRAVKAPPGFRDVGNGDFYVWTEFLYGLLTARQSGAVFECAVLVTDDRKPDWTTKGTVHPMLVAEVASLVDAEFDIWSLRTLNRYVDSSLGSDHSPLEGSQSG